MDRPTDQLSDRRGFLTALSGLAVTGWTLSAARGSAAVDQADAAARWRSRVPALNQQINGHPLAYLDNAATTLRPRAVIDALTHYYERENANPSGTLHTLARRSQASLDAARARLAKFINAPEPGGVIFTRGTTEGVNLVASAWGAAVLRAGDEIVLTSAEHNSNLFPWQRLAADSRAVIKTVDVQPDGRLTAEAIDAAITSRTRLVAITHVSNVLGVVYPVDEICARARRRGVAVLIDAAQSAPHVRLDVEKIGCDFLAFSSHKLLGPMGVGVLWARESRFKEMRPYQVGSNMAHGASLGDATFEDGALRFQAGTPNVSGPVALAAACDVLDEIGFEAIAAHDHALATRLLARLGVIKGLRLIGTAGPPGRIPLATFTIDNVTVPAIVTAADNAGIAIRGGDLAALPLLRQHGVATAARVSAYIYNTEEEIDRLGAVLEAITRGGNR